jgi:hypothetical protein
MNNAAFTIDYPATLPLGTWLQGADETDQFIGGPITVTLPAAPVNPYRTSCDFGQVIASVSVSSADGSNVVVASGSHAAGDGSDGGPVSFLLESTGVTLFEPGAATERSLTLTVAAGPYWGGCEHLQATVDAAAINVVGLR